MSLHDDSQIIVNTTQISHSSDSFADQSDLKSKALLDQSVSAMIAKPSTFTTMSSSSFSFDPSVTLEHLREMQASFALERDWNQFHTPRNLLLALTGEVGELAECFQWKGEVQQGLPEFSAQEKQHVGEELSDVLLYLIRMSDVCKIDLATCVKEKIQNNAQKYPASKVSGKSDKYTAYV
jgi:dCTP diphosphatase